MTCTLARTPDQLLADFKSFVEKVRAALPETRIIMSSLTPSPARWSEIETRKVVNRRLQDYTATQKNVVFVDLFDAYLGADGKPNDEYFVADHLHHSAAGYQVRLKFTRPLLGASRTNNEAFQHESIAPLKAMQPRNCGLLEDFLSLISIGPPGREPYPCGSLL